MISINTLPKITKRQKRRIGRGHGSGRVKTAGKGTKGQKSRGKISIQRGIAGISFIKRLPLFRGKSRNKSFNIKTIGINVQDLNSLPKNAVVDRKLLISKNILARETPDSLRVKILGNGDLNIPLTLKIPCSKGARKKIEKAGGKIEV
jgi:large subunit ribosomal protein L15